MTVRRCPSACKLFGKQTRDTPSGAGARDIKTRFHSMSRRLHDDARLTGAINGKIDMGYRVVVAGATGNVGREMLNILAEREFPADEIAVVASSRSQGDMVDFGDTGK